MGHEREMLALEAKLSRCRELHRQSRCDFTRAHLMELTKDWQSQFNRLDDEHRRLGYWVDRA